VVLAFVVDGEDDKEGDAEHRGEGLGGSLLRPVAVL
jgi:hypothetical protein